MPIGRRSLLLGAAGVALGGCVGPAQWRATALASEPQVALGLGEGLLIGTAAPGLLGPDGAIPVTPTTPYGREVRWSALAVNEDRILGIGLAHGGAHGNARWSVFTGSSRGVTECEQPFDVFHGPDSGQLSAADFVRDRPVVIGSWRSDSAGNDVAVWLLDGARWRRLRSSGTALAASATALPSAAAACGGDRLVLAGQVIELSPLRTRAAAWACTDPEGDWTRIDLPGTGRTTTAQAITRLDDGWLVGGLAEGRAVAWRIAADLTAQLLDVPGLVAAGTVRVAASHDGTALIVAGDGHRSEALVGRPGSWQRSVVPGDAPVAAAWGARAGVITRAAGGATTLYELS